MKFKISSIIIFLFILAEANAQFSLKPEARALEAFKNGDIAGAESIASGAARRNPQNAGAFYVLGRINYERSQYEVAVENFNKAIQNDNVNGEYFFWRGKAYYQLDKNVLAQADFNHAINFDKTKHEYYFFRGITQAYSGLPQNALLDFDKAISLNKSSDAYYFQRASAHLSLQNYQKCLEDIELAVSMNNDPDYKFIRGLAYFMTGKFLEARKDLEEYINVYPDEEDAFYLLAKIYDQEGKKEEAKKNFSKYLSLTNIASPRLKDTYQTLQDHEYYELAIQCAEMLNRNDPTWDLYYDIGYYNLQLKQYDESLKMYKKAISFAPEKYRWEVYNLAAWDMANHQKIPAEYLDVAEEWAMVSIQLNENYSNNETMAFILYLKDQYRDAFYKAERAVDLARQGNVNAEFSARLLVKIKNKMPAEVPASSGGQAVAANASGPKIKGKLPFTVYGVVIGVSNYQYSDINLQYADDDAQLFYDHLLSKEGGAEPENVTLLLNEKATRSNVLKALYKVSKYALDDDLVYIYIASHGMPSAMASELYFLGYDTDPDFIESTGISQSDVERAFKSSRANKKIWIADACHSGAVGYSMGTRGLNDQARSVQVARLLGQAGKNSNNVIILSASSAGQQSLEGKQWGGGHGVFTYYMVKGLKGDADKDHNSFVQVRELYEYIRTNVEEQTGGKQYPELKGQYNDRFPLSNLR